MTKPAASFHGTKSRVLQILNERNAAPRWFVRSRPRTGLASMGPASKNAGYVDGPCSHPGRQIASMGPASKNAGYAK